MSVIIIHRPSAAVRDLILSLPLSPCEQEMAAEFCNTGCTDKQRAWLMHLIAQHGFETVPA